MTSYEMFAREKKARILADHLAGFNITADETAMIPQEIWKKLAARCKLANPPSRQTQELVREMLRNRENASV